MLHDTTVSASIDSNTINSFVPKAKPLFTFEAPKDEIDQAIQAFLTGKDEGKFGRYYIHGDMLVYKIAITEEMNIGGDPKSDEHRDFVAGVKSGKYDLLNCTLENLHTQRYVKYRVSKANLIAQRVNATTYVGNSAALSLIGRTVSFGNESLNRNETDVQRRLFALIPMIPFNVFKQADLDISKFKMIEKGVAESILRKIDTGKREKETGETIFKDETLHFTGASLFEVDGVAFLFDVDRNEIKHKIFNPFLAKLPASVNTIAQAYESLKPQAVVDAENQGLEVLRQGEWFFIPVKGDYQPDMVESRWGANKGELNPKPMLLRAGNNRPNHAELSYENDGIQLVKGMVTHQGREHEPLNLKGWYRPIPNAATESFTIVGDID